MLANLRINPYPLLKFDCDKAITAEHENRLLAMQKFAFDYGCSQTNPSLFFLKHIYASTVINEVKTLEHCYMDSALEAYQIIDTN